MMHHHKSEHGEDGRHKHTAPHGARCAKRVPDTISTRVKKKCENLLFVHTEFRQGSFSGPHPVKFVLKQLKCSSFKTNWFGFWALTSPGTRFKFVGSIFFAFFFNLVLNVIDLF